MHDPMLDEWWRGGVRLTLPLHGRELGVFARVDGEHGPWLTLIHGFPTCSLDWAELVPELARQHRVLSFDLLGFGASDKPKDLPYSTALQADVAEAVLAAHGVEATALVAHDIGTAVAQELLVRHDAGRLRTRLERITFLNGVVFIDHYRPAPLQRLLSHPWGGRLVSALNHERLYARTLRRAFAPDKQPDDASCRRYWQAMRTRAGHRQLHRLTYYVRERLREGQRWQRALCTTQVPLSFVWGMADPFAGAFVAADIRSHLPAAPLRELSAVGHFPQLEARDELLSALC